MTAAEYQQQYGTGKGRQPPVLPPTRHAHPPPATTPPLGATEAADAKKPALRRATAKIAEDEREAPLRPRFGYSDNPLLSGIKFVAYGITEEQALALRAAALRAGIFEQQ